MYEVKQWQDHVTQYENRYTETRNDDGSITHTPIEGEVLQQGTPQNAANFNHIESGISNATELAAILNILSIQNRRAIEDLQGEEITVTLTNSQQYPFNNSKKTISLSKERNHLGYNVTTEITNVSGGFVGEVLFSEKLLNGFKVEYTGSAKSVTLKVYVKGGFY